MAKSRPQGSGAEFEGFPVRHERQRTVRVAGGREQFRGTQESAEIDRPTMINIEKSSEADDDLMLEGLLPGSTEVRDDVAASLSYPGEFPAVAEIPPDLSRLLAVATPTPSARSAPKYLARAPTSIRPISSSTFPAPIR